MNRFERQVAGGFASMIGWMIAIALVSFWPWLLGTKIATSAGAAAFRQVIWPRLLSQILAPAGVAMSVDAGGWVVGCRFAMVPSQPSRDSWAGRVGRSVVLLAGC